MEAYVRIVVTGCSPETRERVMGVAWEDGAAGLEEVSGEELVIYAPLSVARTLGASLSRAVGASGQVSFPTPVDDVDWSEQWKAGLVAIEISPRLVIRPSFVGFEPASGQREIIIDPGQAFGTGSHASTRLCLEWVDAICSAPGDQPKRVLDVGTGSGVLAMSATGLGAKHAVGFDLDTIAVKEARHWVAENGLTKAVGLFSGPIEALAEGTFDLILANLLKREVLPIAAAIASRLAPKGRLVLAGLLQEDLLEIEAAFGSHGLVVSEIKEQRDANGDRWVSPCLRVAS